MNDPIPLFALNYGPEEEEAVIATIRSKWISMGPKTAELEKAFAEMLHCPHAVAVTNCTVALHLAMEILGVGPGDEVIVPSLTFVATANAVRYVGATPVFCDISGASSPNMSPTHLESLITPKTRAITVMHYGGFPCEMEPIMAIARKNNLAVVEDACHGPLSEYRGKKLGTIGDIGCFSFFSNKNISTGEGGMMVMNNPSHFERAKLMRSHGMTSVSYDRARGHAVSYDVVAHGHNYRMDDIRSSLALVQLRRLPADLERRAEIRKLYLKLLANTDGVIVPFADHAEFTSNYIFPIAITAGGYERRDAIRESLRAAGIQTSVHYPPVHRFSIYSEFPAVLPETNSFADHAITLPMFASLRDDQAVRIVDSLIDALCTVK